MISNKASVSNNTINASYDKPPVSNKNIKIVASKNIINNLITDGICSNCLQKDSIIYPGSSFSLCIPCDRKQLYTKEKIEEYLISLGICPLCEQKDSILYPGSSFRTCIKCDVSVSLKNTVKNNDK